MPDRADLSEGAQDQARVFFALWPDERVRGELARVTARLHRLRGGRRTRAETIHLTLLFVGNVPRTILPALQAGAADIRLPVFELVLDQAECWRHNRIAFLTTSQTPATLLDLVTNLESRLDRLGIPFDRRPYVPHVTLLRHADCRPDGPPIQPLRWPVREFVLVESRLEAQGAQYRVLNSYPLMGLSTSLSR
ncbi:MAG: RNA 2',3'-cyclic phosphodiesterase [Thiobacillaceae bacterium]